MSRIILIALTFMFMTTSDAMTVPNVLSSEPPSEFSNSISITFKLLAAGEFLMGAPASDGDAWDDERPQHIVRITRPFYLAETEVTQAQYDGIVKVNPSRFKGASHPVEGVTWHDALEFCRKLSDKEGRTYRLPTEAEWEYACRAGEKSRFVCGDSELTLGAYAWFTGNSAGTTHPVGTKHPNAWGLFDMHGNVWEWCDDSYDPDYYGSSLLTDPRGPAMDGVRICRGGAWNTPAYRCRSSARRCLPPSFPTQPHGIIGFRLALELNTGHELHFR